MILEREAALGELLAREEGKTLAEARGEVQRAGRVYKFFAGECLRAFGDLLPSLRQGVVVEARREPVGVVGLITPWNFPIAIPAWKSAPALAYGNCVVMKPADPAPASAWALADILKEVGLPGGRVQPGDGPRLGGGRGDHQPPGDRRRLLHRLGERGPSHRRGLRAAVPALPARDGRQEPAGGARRRRP